LTSPVAIGATEPISPEAAEHDEPSYALQVPSVAMCRSIAVPAGTEKLVAFTGVVDGVTIVVLGATVEVVVGATVVVVVDVVGTTGEPPWEATVNVVAAVTMGSYPTFVVRFAFSLINTLTIGFAG
jgi:hypothetical protein